MGYDVSGRALCGVRWLLEAAGGRYLERAARRLTPPGSARLLCPPPYGWRAEIFL